MKKILVAGLLLCTLLGACKAERKPAVQLFSDRDAVEFTSGYLFDVNEDGTPEFCCDAVSSYEGYVVQWGRVDKVLLEKKLHKNWQENAGF